MPTLDTRHLGALSPAVDLALNVLETQGVLRRIWQRDHTVWAPQPQEIDNRLGWLDAPGYTLSHLDEIDRVASAASGFRHVVLIGMGGSSLGAEAIRTSVPRRPGAPELLVLDSTVPAWVASIRQRIDPAKTLFVVASKSGTTAEVAALRSFFWQQLREALGCEPGEHFIAVTDPGSPLAEMASNAGYRHVFLNPSDIGGRFSVLSYYGMVPAALAGVDIRSLLEQAQTSAEISRVSQDVPSADPATRLGAVLGAAARKGRDKLTLLTSPTLETFGLWVEQLVAESTGKLGRGILPVTGEPLAATLRYRSDRLFVSLQLDDERDPALDETLRELAAAGHPAIEIRLETPHEFGAELFEWQMATVVASHLIGVHPFDQPDVESTKIQTRALLDQVRGGATLDSPVDEQPAARLAELAPQANYVAIMAYTGESRSVELAVQRVRRLLLERFELATTFGYAPRMLHSTGQYHKGGPDGGLYLQLLSQESTELALPGEVYSLGDLATAQALGDFKALQGAGRTTLRIALGEDPGVALDAFASELDVLTDDI